MTTTRNAPADAINATERGIIARETLISTVPNAIVSAGFVWLVFGRQDRIGLWGISGLAFDLVPTTFMLTLMTTIALTLIFRKRRRDSGILNEASRGAALPLPRNPVARGVVLGLVLLVLFVPLSVAALSALWAGEWSYERVLVFKIIYGVIVGWVATPLVVLAALRERA
ncbi:MAG: hypothetical protein V2I27_13815 [Erythrobacter sp.]|jgi:hypothetical protein|nr:hypothetical protein [Erythrobacter sp.]